MRIWAKALIVAAAALPLSSCLWGPGKFNSTLALHKNGTFVLDYSGEILMQLPDDKGAASEPWNDKMARCHQDGPVPEVNRIGNANSFPLRWT